MNKNIIGARIRADKEKIIEQYINGVDILILAKRYNVLSNTLCARMRKWGIKARRGDYKASDILKEKKSGKAKVSPELLEKRRINTLINNDRIKGIKYIKFTNTTEDQKLVDSIINRPLK